MAFEVGLDTQLAWHQRSKMLRHASIFLSIWAACCPSAFADENTDKRIAASALQEARGIIGRELFGHYDIVDLEVLKTEAFRGQERDYGLVKAILRFATKRNATKSPSLNRDLFEPGSAMCQGWLYLHCGVPVGYPFEGKMEVLLAVDRYGSWRAVSPHWRSRRQYSLHGYLLLDGREKEGYVLFPK